MLAQAQNEHYSVRHLPSTPDILRNSASGTLLAPDAIPSTSNSCVDYRGSILQSPPLALAITHERAYIWDYTSVTTVTHPRTFDVTVPTKSTDPLPIGTLVTNSNTKAIGLLIVSSTTGYITYWENIETAESLSLFQQRNTGIEGNLGALFNGESVVDITSADHAGFVITLSSGRIAHISLTDPQGKPKITAHFLRSNEAAGGSGIFGSIKNTFGLGAWKRDVVSVHTRPLGARREIQVIAATEKAQIQVWDLAWSGQSVYKGTFDFREMLQRETSQYTASTLPLRERPIKVLDMAITPVQSRGDEVVLPKHDTPLDLMLLVQSEERPEIGPNYAIANVIMHGLNARLERLIPIRTETSIQSQGRVRLLIPKPGHTAYIVSEQQIIFASVAPPADDGPEAQLMFESHSDINLFQDALWLRSGKHLVIEGCCEEDLPENRGASACAVFVKGYGLARVTANNPSAATLPRPTIKSKIEQAIFYGTMSDNIFDLSRKAKGNDQYDIDQVERAALRISDEILRSTTPYIPASTPTMDVHLASRGKALRALMLYLNNNYPSISKAISWKLMTDAEKLAAAHAVWNKFDHGLATGGAKDGLPKPVLLPVCIKALEVGKGKGSQSSRPRSSHLHDETDPIRQWFVSDAWNISNLRTRTLLAVIKLFDDGNQKELIRVMSEADDIIFNIYDTVFAFRADNAELYGFNYALMTEGILEEGWEDLEEPWTSNHDVFNTFNRFIDVCREFSIYTFEHPTEHSKFFIDKVVRENVKLVKTLCLVYRERIAYVTVHNVERNAHYPQGYADAFTAARSHHLRSLGKIGQDGAGIELAEKYHDLETLVLLVIGEADFLQEGLDNDELDPVEKALTQGRINELEASIQRYFNDLGADWANAFFDAHLHSHHSYGLLLQAAKYRKPLTKYLRAEKARGRVGWIQDVLREHDFAEAAKALSSLAREQENKVWNKRIELSLGKLASLAVQEEKGSTANAAVTTQVRQRQEDLTIVNIQEAVKESFQPIMFAAVDVEAEVQLVSDVYAKGLKRTLPAFFNFIEIAFEDMLKNIALAPERLIDVLTLMRHVPDSDIAGTEFYLALKVLHAAKKDLDADKFEVLLKLIWKRCWIGDVDWQIINDTKRKSDKLVGALLRQNIVSKTVALALKNCTYSCTSTIIQDTNL